MRTFLKNFKFFKGLKSSAGGAFALSKYVWFSLFSFLFLLIYFFDLAILYMIFNFVYEVFISISVFFSNYFLIALKYSIIYLFIYFVLCLFNISYLGYRRFKFFGFDLDYYKNYWIKYYYYLKAYNYFLFILVHFCILNILMYYIYENLLVVLLIVVFYIIILLGLKIKLKWDKLDKNYKTKIMTVSLNLIIIMILGYYINLIIEFLVYFQMLKINGSDYFWTVFQNKFMIQFNNIRSVSKWFSFYEYKKQYFIRSYFFNFKKIYNDNYILDSWNNNNYAFNNSYKMFNKSFNKSIFHISYINNDEILELKDYKKLEDFDFNKIKHFENNIIYNNSNNIWLYNEIDIKNIEDVDFKSLSKFYNKFTYKNFLYNRLNFIVKNNIQKKDIYPMEKRNIGFKTLLKKDTLNFRYLLSEDYFIEVLNKQQIEYENYILNCKKKNLLYNNFYDILLLKSNFKVYHFIKFNELFFNKTIESLYLNKMKTQLLALLDFEMVFYNKICDKFNNIKYDLKLFLFEKTNLTLKKNFMKKIFSLNNYSFKNSLKNIFLKFHKSKNTYHYHGLIKKNKSYDFSGFIDYIEMYLNNASKQKFFKKMVLKDPKNTGIFFKKNVKLDILNPLRENFEDEIFYNERFFNIKILKKEIEEYALKKYSLRLDFQEKDILAIFDNSYFIENNKIYQLNMKTYILTEISLTNYQSKLLNIKLYEEILFEKEELNKNIYFKELKNRSYLYNKFMKEFFFNKSWKKSFIVEKMKHKLSHNMNLFKETYLGSSMYKPDIFFLFDTFNNKYVLVKERFEPIFIYKYEYQNNKIFMKNIDEIKYNKLIKHRDNILYYNYLVDRSIDTTRVSKPYVKMSDYDELAAYINKILTPWRNSLLNNNISIKWKILENKDLYDNFYNDFFNVERIVLLGENIKNNSVNSIMSNKQLMWIKNLLYIKNININEMPEGYLVKNWKNAMKSIKCWEKIKKESFNRYEFNDVSIVLKNCWALQKSLKANNIMDMYPYLKELDQILLLNKIEILKFLDIMSYKRGLLLDRSFLEYKNTVLEISDNYFFFDFYDEVIKQWEINEKLHDIISERLYDYYEKMNEEDEESFIEDLGNISNMEEIYNSVNEEFNAKTLFIEAFDEEFQELYLQSCIIAKGVTFERYYDLLGKKQAFNKALMKYEKFIAFRNLYIAYLRDVREIFDKEVILKIKEYLKMKHEVFNLKIKERDNFLKEIKKEYSVSDKKFFDTINIFNDIDNYLPDLKINYNYKLAENLKMQKELQIKMEIRKKELYLIKKNWDIYNKQRISEEFNYFNAKKNFNMFNNKPRKEFLFFNKQKKK
jgi:hypothetical protein